MLRRKNKYQDGLRSFGAKDYKTAHDLLIAFAEEGDSDAQAIIGNIYQLGLGGIAVDEERAVEWYSRAAIQGNGVASNNLGTSAFLRGDREKAEKWYNLARSQGFRHSPLPDIDNDPV
jgi:TPR repeat protein